MKHHNTVFHQILKLLSRQRFQAVVDRHDGDRRVRTLSCWDQLVVLLFAQFSGQRSLRDLVDSFNSKKSHHYHLGTKIISRSSLSDANSSRPSIIYEEVFFYLLEQTRANLPKNDSNEMIRLIDSTTIDLNLNQFEWAKFRSAKAGIKLHTVYDPKAEVPVYFEMTHAKTNDRKALDNLPIMPKTTYIVDRAYNDYSWYYALQKKDSVFVGRMKTNARYTVNEVVCPVGTGIISDEIITLSAKKALKNCPIPLRRIKFKREEDGKELIFITNDLQRSAEEIAALYKQRWQIELFFKWIKQNLKIKRFIGRSENAVKIQVLVAMIAYLLLRITQIIGFSTVSLQKICRLVAVNLTSRRSILALLHPSSSPPPSTSEGAGQQAFGFVWA